MAEKLSVETEAFARIYFIHNPDVAHYLIASAAVRFQSPGWMPSSKRVAVEAFEARCSLARLPFDEAMGRIAIAQAVLEDPEYHLTIA